MTGLYARVLLLFLLSFACLENLAAEQTAKTDIIYLHNGDRITGEIQDLVKGILEFKTDHMGTLLIEWDQIAQVVSNTAHSVELTNGQRFYGPLEKPASEDMVAIETEQGEVGVSTLDVITMYRVEASFWERLDLSASLGFSWDKGSNVGKYNLSIDSAYRRPQSITKASFSTELTTQSDQSSTKRANFDAVHNIFLPNKRYHSYFGNLQHNDELGLELRALVGAGYGWVPIRSQRNWFSLGGGLDINREIPQDGASETNLEAVGILVYEYYKYSHPERSFTFNFRVFPSITDFGRWRSNLNTDFRFELLSDLYWKLEAYVEYDSAPISQDAASSDYGVISGISYKF